MGGGSPICALHECEYGRISSPLPQQVSILDESSGTSKGKEFSFYLDEGGAE